ncbi:hypothetical protein, partial [Photobacterium halotolerans]|uniref:hypothetical protein n=1 Tax=Photobacterium halotolerans TaxID=265726 RepID=UPI001F223A96
SFKTAFAAQDYPTPKSVTTCRLLVRSHLNKFSKTTDKLLSNCVFANFITQHQGKIQDEFLGCRRRERLQLARTTPKNQKAFLGTLWASKECLARFEKGEIIAEPKRDIP